jgi:endo-1,4-beta-D-glucanase Y
MIILQNQAEKSQKAPSDKEIADAVKVLSEAGMLNIGLPQTAMMQNPEMAQMAMFTQNSGNINNDMLPLMLMYQNQDKKMSPEAIKMMMSGMMTPDFGSFDNKF